MSNNSNSDSVDSTEAATTHVPESTGQRTGDIEALRQRFYNSTVERMQFIHDDLLIVRVGVDGGWLEYTAGQYTLLGLGAWEPRVDGVPVSWSAESPAKQPLVRRAYSISCPVLDDRNQLRPSAEWESLEFYIALVTRPTDQPPMLTPRLFALEEGDRLFVGKRPNGHYTIAPVDFDDDVVFFATGTGEAPHNAMIAELLSRGHRGQIVSVVCVRFDADLGYAAVHRELESRYDNYRYFTLTTRELRNLDATRADFVGKQYVQEFLTSGALEAQLGCQLEPERCHVFLCGSPAMIGLPRKGADGHEMYPEPPGMVEALTLRGFELDERHRPGNVHFEKYW